MQFLHVCVVEACSSNKFVGLGLQLCRLSVCKAGFLFAFGRQAMQFKQVLVLEAVLLLVFEMQVCNLQFCFGRQPMQV